MSTYIIVGFAWLTLTFIIVAFATWLSAKKGVHYLIALYTGLVVISAVTASKLISIGTISIGTFNFNINVPAGVLVFSATFLITDIISEMWDKSKAEIAVWSGFFCLIFYAAYTYLSVRWPASPFWENQSAYETIMLSSVRIAMAGPIAFIISQHVDVFIFHSMKEREGKSKLWIRNNVSTAISQSIDSIVFITIAFYGLFPIWPLILGQYFIKLIIAVSDTPFIYLSRWLFNKYKKD